MKRLYDVLKICETEEEVKSEFARYFKFKINTKQRFDHYTEQVLYEFKYKKNLRNLKARSSVIAQTIYYIRELKYGCGTKPVPKYICLIEKSEACIFETSKFSEFYTKSKKYDWDRAASMPCPILINDIAESQTTKSLHIYNLEIEYEEKEFINKLDNCRSMQISLFDSDKKEINENNFIDIYNYWLSLFGKYVENGRKASEYFIADIEKGKSKKLSESEIIFILGDGNAKIKCLPINSYDYFWDIYEKISDINVIYAIRQKIDRLTEDYQRRFTGEFYTPISFASKALEYVERVVGSKWWEKGNWRLWDMAAGTGNLEFSLPSSALQYCYISTLLEDDANYCKRIFPTATVFQYDYLNDDIDFLINPKFRPKMPNSLIQDLSNPQINWIIFINPPFATSNTVGMITGKQSKDSVSKTQLRLLMEENGLGETSRELFSQFIYRINIEFSNRKVFLGLFSKLKYINSNNDQILRDKVFNYEFKRGFMFSSECFYGSKGKFPVGFLIWNLGKKKKLSDQKILLDVYNNYVEKYGYKEIICDNRSTFLSKWVDRPRTTNILPPFKSAICIGTNNVDTRNRVANGFLYSLMCCGNDMQHQNQTSLLSGPYVSAGAFSVIESNFEKSMVIHTVRRLPLANWVNDRDQFYQPTSEVLPQEFINDCVVWSAFSDSNNTISMKDVKYNGKVYQIKNALFPYLLNDVKKWSCSLSDIALQIVSANEDRFLALWLSTAALSSESKLILDIGKNIYKLFFQNVIHCQWLSYKIGLWDVGWWQVKMALNEIGDFKAQFLEMKEAHKALGNKLLPKVYEYGFMQKEILPLDNIVVE